MQHFLLIMCCISVQSVSEKADSYWLLKRMKSHGLSRRDLVVASDISSFKGLIIFTMKSDHTAFSLFFLLLIYFKQNPKK